MYLPYSSISILLYTIHCLLMCKSFKFKLIDKSIT